MGLSDETTVDTGNSMTVIAGKWTLRVAEGTAGAVARKLTKGANLGKTVWERGWPTLKNIHLVGGRLVTSEHFTGLNAEIDFRDVDSGEDFLISLPADSRYLKEFIKRLPVIDTNAPMDLELKQSRKKTKTGGDCFFLKLTQGGNLIKDHYVEWKKDEAGAPKAYMLNGIPDAVERMDGLNFDDQNEFLWIKFEDFFKSYTTPSVCLPSSGSVADTEAPDEVSDTHEDDEDIPF